MINAIAQLDEKGLTLAEGLNTETHHYVLCNVVNTRLGGNTLQHIAVNFFLSLFPFNQWKLAGYFGETDQALIEDRVSPEKYLRNYLKVKNNSGEINQVVELLKVLNERQTMLSRIQKDIRYHTLMKSWLFLHIPLSCGLLAAVIIHVLSVFFYW